MISKLGENVRREKIRRVFMEQMGSRLSAIGIQMKRVVSAWMSGVLTDRKFTNTLLFYAAMLEEPEGRSIYFFEGKFDEVIGKPLIV